MSFWGELERRNVIRVGIAYLAGVWLVLQVASVVLPSFEAPAWVMQALIVATIVGFPVAVLLAWFYEITSEGIQPDSGTTTARKLSGRKLDFAIIALLVLIVGFLLVDTDSSIDDAAAAPASIAVLPLDDLSPDAANALYASGMHVEIINQLSKLGGLRVINRESVLPYADERPPLGQIASTLDVSSILLGTFQFIDDRIRVALQLVDPVSGANLWAAEYQEAFADIFEVQSDIAMNVANALAVEFSVAEQQAINRVPTESIAAYDFFLQAQDRMGRNVPEAMRYLDEALNIDPRFALAHSQKAFLYAESIVNSLGQNAVSENERETQIELARQHARQAIASDPTLPEPYQVLAQLDVFTWRWSDAFDELERAARGSAGAPQPRSWLFSYLGEHERAVDSARRNVARDPGNWGAHWDLASTLAYAGHYAEARRAQLEAISLAPIIPILHSWLGFIEIALGNEAEAIASLRRSERLLAENRDIVSLPELAYSYWRAGSRDDADRIYREIQETAAARDIGAGAMAMAARANGDRDEAIRWLEAAIETIEAHEIDQSFYNLMNLKLNVTADPVLEEPVFVELRSRIRGD